MATPSDRAAMQQQLPPGFAPRASAASRGSRPAASARRCRSAGRSRSGAGWRRRHRGRTASRGRSWPSSQSHHVPCLLRTRPWTSPTTIGPWVRICCEHLVDLRPVRREPLAVAPLLEPVHPPAPEVTVLRRHERCRVGPVLEQVAVVDGVGDQRARMRAEPGEQRQLLAAGEHVDRVDLDQADVVEHPPQVLTGHPTGGARAGEPLRGEGDPARGVDGESFGHRSTGVVRGTAGSLDVVVDRNCPQTVG